MIKLAMAQIEVSAGNPSKNFTTIKQAIEYAKALHTDILVFPELSLSGYLIGDLWEQEAFLRECEELGEEIAKLSSDMLIIFGNVGIDWSKHHTDGRVRTHIGLFMAHHGKLLHPEHWAYPFYIKTLQPNYRYYSESRHFTPLATVAQELNRPIESFFQPITVNLHGKDYNLAPVICEDSWDYNYSMQPMDYYAKHKVDLFINISSSNFSLHKGSVRHRVFGYHAKQYHTPIIMVNHVGIQNNGKNILAYDGTSAVYDVNGNMYTQVKSFEDTVRPILLKDDLWDGTYNPQEKEETTSSEPKTLNSISDYTMYDAHEHYEALHYIAKKFLEQTGLKKIVIGVSGGIDSALNAALYSTVVKPENLYLVNMPSRFNSAMTKGLAYELAQNIGAHYTDMSIEDSINYTIQQLESTPWQDGSHLTLSTLAKENIQARDRSSRILAGVASAVGGVFTCNGNKTEFSVGYATLYGDLAGFLALTGDLWKHEVYALSRYMNEYVFGREVIPQGSIDVVPSAELSDAQDITKGLGDPLQYDYHDRLFSSFICNWQRLTPEDILASYKNNSLQELLNLPQPLEHYFTSTQAFIEDLERWWNLLSGFAVSKRIQSPPIALVSRRAFGSDLQESQLPAYYTRKYYELKEELLQE